MTKLILLAVGGALGAVLRYATAGLVHRFLGAGFPWGTLGVNLVGCLLIGFFWGMTERSPVSPNVQAFVFVGLIGGFTTFSTFGLETLNLLRDGEVLLGIANVAASTLLGLLLVFLGLVTARTLFALVDAP